MTNAVHGFTSMVAYLIREHHPSGLAVAFDLPGETFRDEIVEEYKEGRAAAPPDLTPQFDLIRAVLESLAIPVIGVEGFEADDVLATLATEARDNQLPVIIVTGDRDSYQLVEDPFIRVLYNKKGVSDYALYDEAGIEERTGVRPEKYPLLAALRGDPSDNLPGVPGVGEKTAAKLINEYGDLDTLYAHLDALTPKLRDNLAAHLEQVRKNAEVIPLVRDVPLDVHVDRPHPRGLRPRGGPGHLHPARAAHPVDAVHRADERGVLRRRPPTALVRRRLRARPQRRSAEARTGVARGTEAGRAHHRGRGEEGARAASSPTCARGTGNVAIAAAWTGDPGRSPLTSLTLTAEPADGEREEGPSSTSAAGANGGGSLATEPVGARRCSPRDSGAGVGVIAHDAKEIMRSLLPLGVDIRRLVMDTAVAAYLLDPSTDRYRVSDLAGALPRRRRSTTATGGEGQGVLALADASSETAEDDDGGRRRRRSARARLVELGGATAGPAPRRARRRPGSRTSSTTSSVHW